MSLTESRFPIFLSSICSGFEPLRKRLFEEVGARMHLYVDECIYKRNLAITDQLAIADELLQRVREADALILLLVGSNASTRLVLDGHVSYTSFVEVELFQAALHNKEVHFIRHRSYDPDIHLEALLETLGGAFAIDIKSLPACSDKEVAEEVRVILKRTLNRNRILPFGTGSRIRHFVQQLYTARSKSPEQPLRFLGGRRAVFDRSPNLDVAGAVVSALATQMDEERRLARVWIGLRALMPLDYETYGDSVALTYFNRLLSEWARAGAWYGLHGHLFLGCLPALNSMTTVRQRLRAFTGHGLPPKDIAYPGGPLASAKYSIAKRLIRRKDIDQCFADALSDVQKALADPEASVDGLIAIRGSIHLQQGRFSEAVADYKQVLDHRVAAGAPVGTIGEAMSELGYGYLRQWRLRKGLEYCRIGVEHLEQGTSAPGFLVRALKKLAFAYIVNGRLLKARGSIVRARFLANQSRSFDQLGS